MPVGHRILPEKNLAYIWNAGFVAIDECVASMQAFMGDPDRRPGLLFLFDLSRVTEFERDYTRIMELQALMADVVPPSPTPTLVILYAPTKVSREAAAPMRMSWPDNAQVMPRIAETEAEALSISGLSEIDLRALYTVAET